MDVVGEEQVPVVELALVEQPRLETDLNLFAGRREDVLRRTQDGWRIAKRTILLDQNVVLAKNLSVFF